MNCNGYEFENLKWRVHVKCRYFRKESNESITSYFLIWIKVQDKLAPLAFDSSQPRRISLNKEQKLLHYSHRLIKKYTISSYEAYIHRDVTFLDIKQQITPHLLHG